MLAELKIGTKYQISPPSQPNHWNWSWTGGGLLGCIQKWSFSWFWLRLGSPRLHSSPTPISQCFQSLQVDIVWKIVLIVEVDFCVHSEMVPCLWVLQQDGPLAADRAVLSCHTHCWNGSSSASSHMAFFFLTPLIALPTPGSPWPLAGITDMALPGFLPFSLPSSIILTEKIFP